MSPTISLSQPACCAKMLKLRRKKLRRVVTATGAVSTPTGLIFAPIEPVVRSPFIGPAAQRLRQPGQMKPPPYQRRLNRSATQLASSANAFSNSQSERVPYHRVSRSPKVVGHSRHSNDSKDLTSRRQAPDGDAPPVNSAEPLLGEKQQQPPVPEKKIHPYNPFWGKNYFIAQAEPEETPHERQKREQGEAMQKKQRTAVVLGFALLQAGLSMWARNAEVRNDEAACESPMASDDYRAGACGRLKNLIRTDDERAELISSGVVAQLRAEMAEESKPPAGTIALTQIWAAAATCGKPNSCRAAERAVTDWSGLGDLRAGNWLARHEATEIRNKIAQKDEQKRPTEEPKRTAELRLIQTMKPKQFALVSSAQLALNQTKNCSGCTAQHGKPRKPVSSTCALPRKSSRPCGNGSG